LATAPESEHAGDSQSEYQFGFGPVEATIFAAGLGLGTPFLPPGYPNRLTELVTATDDREEMAIETARDPVFTAEQVGWRFALGTIIIVGAYAAWPMIPVVMTTDLDPGFKAGLSGLLGATPFISKFVAVAIMGRPAYYFLKRTVFNRFRRKAVTPAE
jgi:hypothetical protein